jgi:hypothetical protein
LKSRAKKFFLFLSQIEYFSLRFVKSMMLGLKHSFFSSDTPEINHVRYTFEIPLFHRAQALLRGKTFALFLTFPFIFIIMRQREEESAMDVGVK